MVRRFVVKIIDGKVVWVDVTEGISPENGIEMFVGLKKWDILLGGTDEMKPETEIKINLKN